MTDELKISLCLKLHRALDALRRQADQLESDRPDDAGWEYVRKQQSFAHDAIRDAIAIVAGSLVGGFAVVEEGETPWPPEVT